MSEEQKHEQKHAPASSQVSGITFFQQLTQDRNARTERLFAASRRFNARILDMDIEADLPTDMTFRDLSPNSY